MKGFFKILAIVLVCGLVFAFISGLDLFETEEDKINAEIAALDFDDSEALTERVFSKAVLGEWTETDGTRTLGEGDYVCFESYPSAELQDLQQFYIRIPKSYVAIYNGSDSVSDVTLDLYSVAAWTMFYKKPGGYNPDLIDTVKDDLIIYTHDDILKNLEDEDLTEIQVDYLIKTAFVSGYLSCEEDEEGSYSGINHTDPHFGEYRSTLFPLTSGRDIDIYISSEYEYSLFLYSEIGSDRTVLEYVDWRAGEKIHLPAGTAFAISIRSMDGSSLTNTLLDEAVTVK